MNSIINPFKINKWPIKKYVIAILAIQLSYVGLVVNELFINIHIPILMQVTGFLLLSLIPGVIILRIFKLHKLDSVTTLLLSVAISLAFLMSLGFIMNLVYPFLGIAKPLSFISIFVTINVIIFMLFIVSILMDKKETSIEKKECYDECNIYFHEKSLNSLYFLLLLPLLSIIGACLINYYNNNVINILLLISIGLIVLLVGFNKIPKQFYPLIIFLISLSLLYDQTLSTTLLWGADIHFENQIANLVVTNGFWQFDINSNTNTSLAISILAPLYSIILNMSLIHVFKIIFPFIFALVPLGLYKLFEKQTNKEIAFLACFFFVSLFTFYTEMTALAKQQIAELFLVLVVLLLISVEMTQWKKRSLLLFFSVSIVFSHYSITYIMLFMLFMVWIMLFLKTRINLNFFEKVNKLPQFVGSKISLNYLLFFIVIAFAWYMYISNALAFSTIVNIGNNICGAMYTDFLNPQSTQGLGAILYQSPTLLHRIGKYVHLFSQFLIIIGFFYVILRNRMKFNEIFIGFSFASILMLIFSIVLPLFAKALNTTRIYHITLIFLAPFAVIGGILLINFIRTKFSKITSKESFKTSIKVLSAFFVIFFFFNSGLIYLVGNDTTGSIPLSKGNLEKYLTPDDEINYYRGYVPETNYYSIKWLSKNGNQSGINIRAGKADYTQIVGYINYPFNNIHCLPIINITRSSVYSPGVYIYLGELEVNYGIIDKWSYEGFGEESYYNTSSIEPILDRSNEIYSNGHSEINVI